MQEVLHIRTNAREGLYDITREVESVVKKSSVKTGMCNVYTQGSTAAIMIQENWDDSVQTDVINLLRKIIPQGVWLHDRQDNNGDSHLKAGLVGPNETIPIVNGRLGLSQWQNIFLCDFDGPRSSRNVIVTLYDAGVSGNK
jgi:secondary thiamine-phosphate synthase enzyme